MCELIDRGLAERPMAARIGHLKGRLDVGAPTPDGHGGSTTAIGAETLAGRHRAFHRLYQPPRSDAKAVAAQLDRFSGQLITTGAVAAELMAKHADTPMDFADATLVMVGEPDSNDRR